MIPLLGVGGLFAVALCLALRQHPPKGEVLAVTGLSAFQSLGAFGCFLVFGAIWAEELSALASGERAADLWVFLWSGLLALAGLALLWASLVRRVWCTSQALIQRTWRGQLLTVPFGEIAGGKAAFSFDDVTIPWGEGRLVLDRSLPNFAQVADLLEKQGVDLSAMPPKRTFLSRKDRAGEDPFQKRR